MQVLDRLIVMLGRMQLPESNEFDPRFLMTTVQSQCERVVKQGRQKRKAVRNVAHSVRLFFGHSLSRLGPCEEDVFELRQQDDIGRHREHRVKARHDQHQYAESGFQPAHPQAAGDHPCRDRRNHQNAEHYAVPEQQVDDDVVRVPDKYRQGILGRHGHRCDRLLVPAIYVRDGLSEPRMAPPLSRAIVAKSSAIKSAKWISGIAWYRRPSTAA